MAANTPKMVREALCVAQSALGQRARDGIDVDLVPRWRAQLGALIAAIDEHRPLDPDGKHGDGHTATCGCDGHRRRWCICLTPANVNPEENSNGE